jgi:hypothetical protein
MTETPKQQLQVIPPAGHALAPAGDVPTTGEMFREIMTLIRSGKLNSEGVQAATEALKLAERMYDRTAKEKHIAARVAMMPQLKKVIAIHPVTAKDGTVKYLTARFDEIDDQVRPILAQNGFSVSFKEGPRLSENLITKIMVLQHSAGHQEEYPYTTRVGTGPYQATQTQADAAAHTSAKRRVYCDALNIVIAEEEDDETALGQFITPQEAAELKALVEETQTDVKSFLAYCGGAPDFEHIFNARAGEAKMFLQKRQRLQAKTKTKGKPAEEPATAAAGKIPADVARALRDRVLSTGADWTDFLKPFKVTRFDDLTPAQLDSAQKKVAALEGKAT